MIAIILAAVALRFWGLPFESLDGDEVFSYRVASDHLSSAIAAIRNDLVHPPLYYFLLRARLDLVGKASPLALRTVSLISGVAAVALVASLGFLFQQIRGTALIAACLLAANNRHIFFSQQARSYAFFTLLFACLLAWSWQIGRSAGKFPFWCIGALLMSLLVYTHYLGALYAALIIIAITFSPVPRRAKLHTWSAGLVAACSFIPWILAELGPIRQHHGAQDNLSWVSVPSIYDLKAIWADYLGVPAFRGATTCVLLIGCALIAFGVFYRRREQTSFRRLFLTTLLSTAFVPPLLLFLLSHKPISLPLFGVRHLLPSIISYLLLVADGLIQLLASIRARTVSLVAASAALLALELIPTIGVIRGGPRRIPFQTIVNATHGGVPLYTTWPYGIGSPMNFYERGRDIVRAVPLNRRDLPDHFILIFRPALTSEEQGFEVLLHLGWTDVENRDFYNGSRTGFYVRAADLQHVPWNAERPR